MPQLRLIGLVLFITSFFLVMAAAVTQTTHIRFKRPGSVAQSQSSASPDNGILPGGGEPLPDPQDLSFVSVPVIYPLVAAGLAGLVLWFVPAPRAVPKAKRKRSRQRGK